MKIKTLIKDKRLYAVIFIVVILAIAIKLFLRYKNTFLVQKFMYMDNKLKYFVMTEFDCPATSGDIRNGKETYVKSGRVYLKDSGKDNMSDTLLNKLDKIRGLFGYPIIINSGYRTPEYNDTLANSVKNSAHIDGLAVDIDLSRYTTAQRVKLVELLRQEFIRIGVARNFYHVDIDDSKPQKEWTYA